MSTKLKRARPSAASRKRRTGNPGSPSGGVHAALDLFATSPDAVFVLDASCRFLQLNEAARKVFRPQARRAELPPELRERFEADVAAALQGAVVTRDLPLDSGTLEYTLSPCHEPGKRVVAVSGIARDVQDRAQAQESLREAQAALLRATATRDEFLSMASHELNTPLTSVSLHVQALQRSLQRADAPVQPAQLTPKLGQVRRQLGKLSGLVRELLDLSRLEPGKLPLSPEPMDASTLLRELLQRDVEEFARAGSPVLVDAPLSLAGTWDRARLEQVLDILLSNARKFGRGKPIEVGLRRDAQHLTFTVRDHGIGIAPEALPRIFQRFERAASERHYGGFGLGLWIARRVVDAMGGTLEVSSAVGKGATFRLTLPV